MVPEILLGLALLGLNACAHRPAQEVHAAQPSDVADTPAQANPADGLAETGNPNTGEPAGHAFQASRIAPRETLWMLEWTQVQGRAQIAQQWRQLRQQYPQWMSERFIIARPVANKKERYTLFIGNFSSIEQGEELCEILRAAFPACQVLPGEAISGGGTSLKMSLQLTPPEPAASSASSELSGPSQTQPDVK